MIRPSVKNTLKTGQTTENGHLLIGRIDLYQPPVLLVRKRNRGGCDGLFEVFETAGAWIGSVTSECSSSHASAIWYTVALCASATVWMTSIPEIDPAAIGNKLLRAQDTLREIYDRIEKRDDLIRYETAPRPEH